MERNPWREGPSPFSLPDDVAGYWLTILCQEKSGNLKKIWDNDVAKKLITVIQTHGFQSDIPWKILYKNMFPTDESRNDIYFPCVMHDDMIAINGKNANCRNQGWKRWHGDFPKPTDNYELWFFKVIVAYRLERRAFIEHLKTCHTNPYDRDNKIIGWKNDDEEIASHVIIMDQTKNYFFYFSERIKGMKSLVLKAVEHDCTLLISSLPHYWQDDRDVVVAAIGQNFPISLYILPEKWRNDKEIMLYALSKMPQMIDILSEDLMQDLAFDQYKRRYNKRTPHDETTLLGSMAYLMHVTSRFRPSTL